MDKRKKERFCKEMGKGNFCVNAEDIYKSKRLEILVGCIV